MYISTGWVHSMDGNKEETDCEMTREVKLTKNATDNDLCCFVIEWKKQTGTKMSCVIYHVSHVMCSVSRVTCCVSCITCQTATQTHTRLMDIAT